MPDSEGAAQKERRVQPRATYELTVPAFGKRALRVLVGRDLSIGGMRIERLPALEVGDRLHLADLRQRRRGAVPGLGERVARDDGDAGMGVVFDPLEPELARRLERLVTSLPAVESLRDGEVEAMGTVVSEILPGVATAPRLRLAAAPRRRLGYASRALDGGRRMARSKSKQKRKQHQHKLRHKRRDAAEEGREGGIRR